jgi:hypothetical protein
LPKRERQRSPVGPLDRHNGIGSDDLKLGYAPPPVAEVRNAWAFFIRGAVLGEALSMLLLLVLEAGGPIFPFTLLFAPVAVVVEMIGTGRALYAGMFVVGPLLYGLYAWLFVLPNQVRYFSIAGVVHLLCFAITLWQRAVFSLM